MALSLTQAIQRIRDEVKVLRGTKARTLLLDAATNLARVHHAGRQESADEHAVRAAACLVAYLMAEE